MKLTSRGRRSSSEPIRYVQQDGVRSTTMKRTEEVPTQMKRRTPRPKMSTSVEKPRRSVSSESVTRTYLSRPKSTLPSKNVSTSVEVLYTPPSVPKYSQMFSAGRPCASNFSAQVRSSRLVMGTRPLCDKTQVKVLESRVSAFLIENGFSNTSPFQNIRSFTTSLFMEIFNFLYNRICPGEKKVAINDVPETMKKLGFKEYQGIKSALKTVGSLHSWPRTINLLYWLVVFIECSNTDAYVLLFHDMNEDTKNEEILETEFLIKGYRSWNERGDKGIKSELETLEDDLTSLKHVRTSDLLELEEEKSSLESRHEPLTYVESCKEVERLESEKQVLLRNKDTIVASINDYECNQDTLVNQISDLRKRYEESEVDVNNKEEYLQQLKSICANQEMSTVERDNIMSQCNELKRKMDRIEAEIQGLHKLQKNLETKWARKKIEIDDICADYNTKLHNLESFRNNDELRIRALDIEEYSITTLERKLNNIKKTVKQELKKLDSELEEEKERFGKEQQKLEILVKETKELQVKLDIKTEEIAANNRNFEEKQMKLEQERETRKAVIRELMESFPDLEALRSEIQQIKDDVQKQDNKLEEINIQASGFFQRLIHSARNSTTDLLEEGKLLKAMNK